ncbi:ribonuclease III [Methylonatrum kenyense]|uniref:ribonuclease III n=1 Tax=Methylonatrum kenyense TaxID=455253 RepID=UPI0020BD7FE5|nr:ribonuclease III [Methylonatrum kenyense]MCK8514742.1 ribonuclease III [Methylonatrum kenyense]
MIDPVDRLLDRLDYRFTNPQLLEEALTHRSVSECNNERLEFLGDSILNFVIASELFFLKDDASEGALSRLRASLVNRETLAEIARDLDLGECLRLGSGEKKSGGRRRDSILSDSVESILGAVYTDSGYDACRDLILRLYQDRLASLPEAQDLKDPKTRLQEYLQSSRQNLPSYEVVEVSGKAHQQVFEVECRIEGVEAVTRGEAGNRRRAEQAAAKAMLDNLLAGEAEQ